MTVLEKQKASPDEWVEPAWEIARLFPAQGHWAVEDYLNLNTNHLVEFSHGIVDVLPMPSDKHQAIVGYLITILSAFAQRVGGVARVAPLRMQLWEGKIREPDLLFLASAQDPRRQDAMWLGADLVMEVISPDDPNRDLVKKRFEYARAGIPEYWIIDPRSDLILVLQLDGDRYTESGRFERGQTATSVTYPEFQVNVSAALNAN
jgi:Uma2 family endonuclease